MDRSFGASTSVLHTPSPLDRRSTAPLSGSTLLSHAQLAQSVAPSASTTVVQPLSFNPGTVPIRSTTSTLTPSSLKTVRFSPAAAAAVAHSSAPPSRIQGFATPPRSYGSPSLLRTAAANSSAGYGLGSGAVATPPRQTGQGEQQQQHQGQQAQQYQSPHSASKLHLPRLPVQAALAKSSDAVHAVQGQLHHAGDVVHSAKKKLEAAPLGRGETARRLRVNAVLLVAWWVSSRTTVYRFAAGHLVAAAPQLDTPLHVCETLLLLLLCYNIIDSLRTLNKLSSLPSASTTVAPLPGASPARPTALRAASSSSSFGTPVRSSPKTRPSASPFKAGAAASPSLSSGTASGSTPAGSRLRGTPQSPFRASALASPSPPTPQTPTSALRSAGGKGADGEASSAAAAALRRSLGRSAGAQGGNASPKEVGNDEVSAALLAYEARHAGDVSLGGGSGGGSIDSPRSVRVESREDVERLFGSVEQ